jgi:hypothetical protein
MVIAGRKAKKSETEFPESNAFSGGNFTNTDY